MGFFFVFVFFFSWSSKVYFVYVGWDYQKDSIFSVAAEGCREDPMFPGSWSRLMQDSPEYAALIFLLQNLTLGHDYLTQASELTSAPFTTTMTEYKPHSYTLCYAQQHTHSFPLPCPFTPALSAASHVPFSKEKERGGLATAPTLEVQGQESGLNRFLSVLLASRVALALRCCLFSIASWSLCLPYPLGPPQMTPIKLGWMRPVCQGILYLHLSPCSFYTHIVSQSYLMPALGIQSILQVFITPCSKQNLLTLGIHVISKAFWKIKIGSYCCGVGCSALRCRLYAENHSLTIAKLVQLARAFSVLITGCAAGTQLKLEWIEVCPSYGNTCGLWPHAILILRCSRCPLMARAPLILCSCCVFGIALIAKFLHE